MSRDHAVRGIAVAMALAAGPLPAAAYDNPAWTEAQAPFRIAGNVYYVGSKGLAAYLITTPKGHILLDGTVAENAQMIEANIRKLGFRLHDVKILLNGHAHHDHAGGLAQLKKDTGARLLASPGDRWALEHGQPRGDNTASLPSFPPVKVDALLKDGEVIRLGPIAMTTVFTPGHTPGCTSWTLPVTVDGEQHEVLFPCSLTVAGNVLVHNKVYPGIAADYRKTFDTLDQLSDADIFLTEHPEVADVLGRHESETRGDKHAWLDPGLMFHLLEDARAQYDSALGKPPRPMVNPAAPSPKDGQLGWRTVACPKGRFAIQLPGAPTVVEGRYDLGGGMTVPARTYAVEQDKVVYRLTMADLSGGRAVDRGALIRDAIDRLTRRGVVRTFVEARVRTAYGRQVSVERPGGARATGSVFLAGDRLFELEAVAPGPQAHAAGAAIIRFQQSLDIWR